MDEVNVIWPQWHIVELIGAGSFGKVYKVKREEMGNVSYSAVKVMHIPQDESEIRDLQHSGMDFESIHAYFEDMIKNLLNEIQIMESLKSANNIVGIEDYQIVSHEEEIGWDIYIRMELLNDLGSYLESHSMSEAEVVKMGIDICQALVACEKVNIIHRDIKIDNILVNRFGSFKLGDFGISKQLEKTRSAVSQKGTNMYMAPEVFRGESYNKTVDIYSLGILMYRLLNNGRFPFMPSGNQPLRFEDTQNAMSRRISGATISLPPGASQPLGEIVLKACAYQSKDRYQSAFEMLEALKQYAAKTPVVSIGGDIQEVAGQDKSSVKDTSPKTQNEMKFSSDKDSPSKDAFTEEKTNSVFNNGVTFQNTNPHSNEDVREKMAKKAARSDKKGVWIVAAIVLVLALAGGTGYYVFHRKQVMEYNQKIEQETKEMEYNQKIDRETKLLDAMIKNTESMKDVTSEKATLIFVIEMTEEMESVRDIDGEELSDEWLKEVSQRDMAQFIYKPGERELYSVDEALELLEQSDGIRAEVDSIENNDAIISEGMAADETYLVDIPGMYEKYLKLENTYKEPKNLVDDTIEDMTDRLDDVENKTTEYGNECDQVKKELEELKKTLPKKK